jgi:hypothetical protein
MGGDKGGDGEHEVGSFLFIIPRCCGTVGTAYSLFHTLPVFGTFFNGDSVSSLESATTSPHYHSDKIRVSVPSLRIVKIQGTVNNLVYYHLSQDFERFQLSESFPKHSIRLLSA